MRTNFYKSLTTVFSLVLCWSVLSGLLFSTFSALAGDAPPGQVRKTNAVGLLPYRSSLFAPGDPRLPYLLRRLPGVDSDPIRFSLHVNKRSIRLNEPVEITITAELLNISPAALFSLPGANTYRLKMLLPAGFEQTGGDFVDYIGGDLSYPSRTFATYRITGHFTSVTGGAGFRLLRSHGQADNQSLFVEKAKLGLQMLPAERNTPIVATTEPTLFVVSEPTPSGARTAGANYTGYLDVATCESIGGWVMDDNNPRQSVQVDIFINDKKAVTLKADMDRPDVAKAKQIDGFSKFGYYWFIPAEYKTGKTLSVAVKVTDNGQELTRSPRTTEVCGNSNPEPPKPSDPPANPNYLGYLDVATCEAVGGWVIDRNNPRTPIQVDIFIDDKKVTTVSTDIQRQDVADAFQIQNYNRYGYYWLIPEEYRKNAALKISARPANTSAELIRSPRTTDVCKGTVDPPKPEEPPANANYVGYLDVATCEVVGGWAIDLNNARRAVQVDIFINDKKVTTVSTDIQRQDVADAYQVQNYNRYGYYWRIPDEYRKNAALKISARPASTTREFIRSPRTTEVCPGTGNPPPGNNCAFELATDPITTTCGGTVTLNARCNGTKCDSVSYKWTGNGIDRTGQSVQIQAPSTNGQYTYTVTATRNNCTPKTATVVVTVSGCNPPPPDNGCAFELATDPITTTCGGTITLNARCNGTKCDSVSYKWSGNGIDRTGQSVQIQAPSSNGQYTYTVTATRRGCTAKTATVVVTVSGCNPPPPSGQCAFEIATDQTVQATCGSTVTLNAHCNGTKCDSISYVWKGNGIDRPGQSVQIQVPSTSGQYSYTVTATRNNCTPKTATVVVNVSGCNPPPPDNGCAFELATDPITTTCGGTVTLNARCNGAKCDSVSYKWTGNGIDRTGQSVQIQAPSSNGQYTYTVTATRRGCTAKTATVVVTVNGCNNPPPPGEYPILNSEPPADKRPVLQNGRIRVAIDLGVGGVIREVTDLQVGENMINCMIKGDGKRDPGRDDQISLYSLPADNSGWTQNGKPLYRDIGYNPVQGGDIAGNFSPILGYGRTDNMLYCKTRGLHWGMPNEPGNHVVEQWIWLEGNIVKRHIRITGDRPDQTKYADARQQELPCTYTNSAYYQYYVIYGEPYTNAPLINVNSLEHLAGSGQTLRNHTNGETGPYDVDSSEPWIMAVRPNSNRGLALHTPYSHEFKVALFQELGYGPPESVNAGYIANGMSMILDHNGVYEYDVNMVVGTVDEMRNTLNTLPRSETKPHYVFPGGPKRHGFYYRKGYDQGYPMAGDELIITPTDRRFKLASPHKGYRASETRTIYIRFRAITTETRMVFRWRKVGQTELESEMADQQITFPIRGDNQYQTIAIPVGQHGLWNGTINEFTLGYPNPTETPVSGQQLGVKWISTEDLGQ